MQKFERDDLKVSFDLTTLEVKVGKDKTQCKSKSEMFKIMYDAGMDVCEISRACDAHYSFVYGVISTSREIRKVEKVTASDNIRSLFDQGKKPGEIAKMLNKNYSFVFGVIKKYKETLVVQETIEEEVEKAQ